MPIQDKVYATSGRDEWDNVTFGLNSKFLSSQYYNIMILMMMTVVMMAMITMNLFQSIYALRKA